MRSSTAARVGAALIALGLVATGCSSGGTPKAEPSASPAGPTTITIAVYGPERVLAAYRAIAADFNDETPDTVVKVQTFTSHTAAVAARQRALATGAGPDLFEIDGEDLPGLIDAKAVRRVDDLLIERRVDFGDGYSRTSLEAFSADSALQCMPTDYAPLVVYYNTRLIDLSLAAEPDTRPVTQDTGWTLDEFRRVALLARKPGVRGLYIAPELRQVAPFIWSGGGDLVDDPDAPTSLALSEDSSATALQDLLELVRDPAITFGSTALQRSSAVERFKAGKLGMMLGYRDLTPTLRTQEGLNFDVMPLPRAGGASTDASVRGICLDADTEHAGAAADFLTFAVSTKSAQMLAETGYAMPTNLDALDSDSFLQRGQRPLHGNVFAREVRHVEEFPRTATWPAVLAATREPLERLFYDPDVDPVVLAERLAALDEVSRPILDPGAAATDGPSASSSQSPSE